MLKDQARSNRKSPTPAENRLWYFLRNRRLNGYKFVREEIIGIYIADFVCRSRKIIIEVDGGHHAEPNVMAYDRERTVTLNEQGYEVIRVWNTDVLENIDGVLEFILQKIEMQSRLCQNKNPHPQPLSQRKKRAERGERAKGPDLY